MKWLYLAAALVASLLMVREALVLTRERRIRRAGLASSRPAPDLRTRLIRRAAMPVFLLLVALVVAGGMLLGVLIGPH
jgi:ABC-type Fe3+ transport system permease subunit